MRRTQLTLPAKTSEINNTVSGRILYLLIDGQKFKYVEDIEPFLTSKAKSGTFSVCADKLLLPKFDTEKTIDIVYYTKNCVSDSEGREKKILKTRLMFL